MGRVEGKVAIVTGGAQGLGEAAVKRLSEEGASVVVADTNTEAGGATAEKYGASFFCLDVRQETQWQALIADTQARYGCLDILVNNAGVLLGDNTVDETPIEDFQRVIDINLTGSFLGCKYAVRAMKQKTGSNGGSIINLSSVAGLRGSARAAAYNASKGGVCLLTKSVAVENAAHAIRCNSVHPGIMHTAMLDSTYQKAGDSATMVKASLEHNIPLGHVGAAIDIGNMVLFLASDESNYITGAEMVVDGGLTARLPM